MSVEGESPPTAPPFPLPPPAAGRRLLLLLAAIPLFFWRLGSHDLWPPDELRFALVAQEMAARHDGVVLSLNNHLYTDKPPLFFWAINGFGLLLGGVNEWSARLPSAVAATLVLLLIDALGGWMYDAGAGFVAALVFATSVQIFLRARWGSIDMTLTLFVLVAIVLFWKGRRRPETEKWCYRAAWAMMGLATLAKGPVGLILPILVMILWALVERNLPSVRRIFLPSGILLYLVVTLAWFGAFARRLGAAFALQVLMHQNVERYVHAWNAQHPVWYYLWRFPAGFFPWILLLPWGIAQALSEEGEERRREARFLVAWIAAVFLFFSFSIGKRGVYIIPLYPAASILVGLLLARASEREEGAAGRRLRVPLGLWCAVMTLLAVVLPLVARRRTPELVPAAAGIALVLAAGAWIAFLGNRRGRSALAVGSVLSSALIVPLLAVATVFPWINRQQNVRGFAEQVGALLRPDIPFATTEEKREAWVFYTGRFAEEVDSRQKILEYLSRNGPRDLLIEEDKLREVRGDLPGGTVDLLRGRVSGQEFHLLRCPAPGAGSG